MAIEDRSRPWFTAAIIVISNKLGEETPKYINGQSGGLFKSNPIKFKAVLSNFIFKI